MNEYISPFSYHSEKLERWSAYEGKPLQLTELEELVLRIVNRVMLITSHLLCEYLEAAGLNASKDETRKSLARLFDNGYVDMFQFRNCSGHICGPKVFTVGEFGRKRLHSQGIKPINTHFLEEIDALQVKRQLSALQFIIKEGYVQHAAHTYYCQIVEASNDPAKRGFRAHALIKTPEKIVCVESVRKGRVRALSMRLKRMALCFDSNKKNYEIVVIGENYTAMKRLMNRVDAKLHGPLRNKVFFTSDEERHSLYMLPDEYDRGGIGGFFTRLFHLFF